MCRKVIWAALLLLLASCGGGGGGSSGSAPEIEDVAMFNVNDPGNPLEALSFQVGDFIDVHIDASDPDKDIKKAWITEYYPADSDDIWEGPLEAGLPSQSTPDTVFFLIEPLEVTPPAGGYRAEITLEDSRGHLSNTWTIYYSVN